jgi:pimeloyl-ACP methyl ester carboxylesterase
LVEKRIDAADLARADWAATHSGGSTMRKTFVTSSSVIAALVLPLLLGVGSCPREDLNPIIFVHGGSGSGAQFESQAMRFTSNGYPPSHIRVLEYDSSAIATIMPQVLASLDALIAEIQAETGAAQVDLMGHSLGTTVSHNFLATPERAVNVAHYVNIDGRTATAPPGGVPTLALWAGAVNRPTPPLIVGATNVTIPNQEHVQVATSEEAFFEMYHFLRGRAPFTTHVLPELRPRISGRVTNFPQNTGLDGATLEVWLVNGHTGQRIDSQPKETFAIGPDGGFGPFKSWFGLSYELVVRREGAIDLNYFYEPFLRSNHLTRLNVAVGLDPFITASDNHVAVTVLRYKEFWGDRGAENDVLEIGGTDVINATTAPSGSVGTASVAFFAFDVGSDGVSNLTTIPFPFNVLGFLTAADLFIPTDPPGTLSIETVPRGDFGAARTVNVPNTPSTQARLVVQLRDFEQ